MDGNGYSTLVMQFDISAIKTLLETNSFTCNLKTWDAGTIFEPTITLKPVDLFYFKEDFIEGDGFSFVDSNAVIGPSNYNLRDNVNPWTGVFTTGLLPALTMQNANEDLVFNNLDAFISDAITNNVNPNFGIRVATNDVSGDTFTKFIHTRFTRTIFKPYLEFFISSDVIDGRYNAVATKPTNLYLTNQIGDNFIGTVTANIVDTAGNILASPIINNPSEGVYYITYTPNISLVNDFVFDQWLIDGVEITKNLVKVKSPNQINQQRTDGLFFFPTTSYIKPIIRQNDKLYMRVTSEIRGKGSYLGNYEYKVVCVNNFEMQPWQPVNLYDNQLYFTIDTAFYFPELEYEVFVRLNDGNKQQQTSNATYKFRVVSDRPTHLADKSASPYQSRDRYLKT